MAVPGEAPCQETHRDIWRNMTHTALATWLGARLNKSQIRLTSNVLWSQQYWFFCKLVTGSNIQPYLISHGNLVYRYSLCEQQDPSRGKFMNCIIKNDTPISLYVIYLHTWMLHHSKSVIQIYELHHALVWPSMLIY